MLQQADVPCRLVGFGQMLAALSVPVSLQTWGRKPNFSYGLSFNLFGAVAAGLWQE
jgi:hypothetical protein